MTLVLLLARIIGAVWAQKHGSVDTECYGWEKGIIHTSNGTLTEMAIRYPLAISIYCLLSIFLLLAIASSGIPWPLQLVNC